jgi:cytidylate kinase
VYLTARLAVRAGRRHKEVEDLDYEQVAADMAVRDTIDATREVDPLAMAHDAVFVDTTDRSVEAIVDELLARL